MGLVGFSNFQVFHVFNKRVFENQEHQFLRIIYVCLSILLCLHTHTQDQHVMFIISIVTVSIIREVVLLIFTIQEQKNNVVSEGHCIKKTGFILFHDKISPGG